MYFKDEKNCLHFLSADDIANGALSLLPAGCIEITENEADSIKAAIKDGGVPSRKEEIKLRLTQIDIDSVRPLRAIAAGFSTQYDIDKLASLDEEAATLRAELVGL